VDQAVEKSPGGDDDGFGGDAAAVAEENAFDAVASCQLPVVSTQYPVIWRTVLLRTEN
jgi:hypothetical protein